MRGEGKRDNFTCDYLVRDWPSRVRRETQIGNETDNKWWERDSRVGEREISLSLIESREGVWIECGLSFKVFCAMNVCMLISDSLGHILKHHQGFRLYEKKSKVLWLGCCEESVTFDVVSSFLSFILGHLNLSRVLIFLEMRA
jgi:hypothetical protein